MKSSNGSGRGVSPAIVAATTFLVAALAGFGAVYVMARTPDNALPRSVAGERIAQAQTSPSAPASAPLPSGPGVNPFSVGEMSAFVFKKAPEALPEFAFFDGTGKERSLKDWRGKVVLLNLWATWCVPCRKEMPALDRLQGALGSGKFEVVALGADRTGIEGARKFLDSIKVAKLALYSDPTARVTSTLKVVGLPATLLLDREGREIGRLIGPAEWDSADAKRLIEAAIAAK